MPREIITLQVGQAGNQIGSRFWEDALIEHGNASKQLIFDNALSTFFVNVDSRTTSSSSSSSSSSCIPVGDGTRHIHSLRARAILVDMEEGVVDCILRGPLAELFDSTQRITDYSGSGNNWAQAHCIYGQQHHTALEDKIRIAAEQCDSLQSFFLLHSLGGGTGSGLGTYLLSMLQDTFPNVYRFATSVFPSHNDDVITSPYNTMLSLGELIEHADCVLPVENQCLISLSSSSSFHKPHVRRRSNTCSYHAMNGIASRLLIDLTSSMRFDGSLNIDLNEITTNLVPFPRMHFLLSSISPSSSSSSTPTSRSSTHSINSMFSHAFDRKFHLIQVNPKRQMYLACAFLLRGDVRLFDINRNIDKLRCNIKMPSWNEDGFKFGLSSTPPSGMKRSLLCLSNNVCLQHMLSHHLEKFNKLYHRKAHVHHYTRYMDIQRFAEAKEKVQDLIKDYQTLETKSLHINNSKSKKNYT